MNKLRHFLLIIFLASCPFALNAQDDELMIKLRTGHNAVFGGFAAFSLETLQDFGNSMHLNAGVQYNTIGKVALEARPACFVDCRWGRISAETLLAYRNIASVNSFAAGAGAEFSNRRLAAKLGYYYHLYGYKGNSVKEPFNIYYELMVNLLPKSESMELQLVITNSEIFELERHYQPSFIAQCSYDLKDYLGLSMGVGLKPAGIFNISADYYQSFINLGICYRW